MNCQEYLLMNKNTPVLSFFLKKNEFEEISLQEQQWFVAYKPIGYQSLQHYLEHRRAPNNRDNIPQLLERYGCDDLEGFLNVTHAVSLNNTFWVRKADSGLSWENVSLY